MQGLIGSRLRALFVEIGTAYDISIKDMEVTCDHVHLFCAFPPKPSCCACCLSHNKTHSRRAPNSVPTCLRLRHDLVTE